MSLRQDNTSFGRFASCRPNLDKSEYINKKDNLKKLNYQNSWNDVNQKLQKIINEN